MSLRVDPTLEHQIRSSARLMPLAQSLALSSSSSASGHESESERARSDEDEDDDGEGGEGEIRVLARRVIDLLSSLPAGN